MNEKHPTPAVNSDPLLTVEQAADYTSMSVSFIRKRIQERSLPAVYFGRTVRIRQSVLEQYLADNTSSPQR